MGLLKTAQTIAVTETRRNLLDKADLALPKHGIIRGRRIERMIRNAIGDVTFDELHYPFRAVATDLENGRAPVGKRRGGSGAIIALLLGVLVTGGAIALVVALRNGNTNEPTPMNPLGEPTPTTTITAQGPDPNAPTNVPVPTPTPEPTPTPTKIAVTAMRSAIDSTRIPPSLRPFA